MKQRVWFEVERLFDSDVVEVHFHAPGLGHALKLTIAGETVTASWPGHRQPVRQLGQWLAVAEQAARIGEAVQAGHPLEAVLAGVRIGAEQ